MKDSLLLKTLPITLGVVGLGLAAAWWACGSGRLLEERVPGQDRSDGGPGPGSSGKWDGKLIQGTAPVPGNFTGLWPWFRGPDSDNVSKETVPLAKSWPPSGPPVLWKIDVGEGFAAAAICRGRVYLIDYDHKNQADALRCLSLADGQEIWRYAYSVKVKRNHGMSRTVPAVTGKYVVSIGPKCHVVCLDAISGELRWKKNLVSEFDTEVPPWYAGQCPLIDGDRLILGTGGSALVVAVEIETGKVLWQSPNPARWQMTHSSPISMEFKGRRMYVYCASGGVAGVSAADGRILWESPDWKISMANIPGPLHLGDGRLFFSGGYNAGSLMIQLKEAGDKFAVETLFRLKPTVFGATQHTPILHLGHLFGVRPDGQLACLDLGGKPVWESGAANRFGLGPFMIAQDVIYAMNDEGLLTMAEASTTGFQKLGQAKVLPGPDAWGPMALADGRLILRDMNQMVCLEVGAKEARSEPLKP
jgi:outer membrane protein assembly factor BamB